VKIQAKAGYAAATLDDSDAGEGLAIFFSQGATDVTRWRVEVLAKVDSGAELLVGVFFVSPPNATPFPGQLTRQVAAAVCPGAKSWSVIISAAVGSQAAQPETADITLISSKCCTAPVGLSRVSERYRYEAGSQAGGIAVGLQPGSTPTGISAVGLAGGGTVQIGTGAVITVAAGVGLSLEPKALIQAAIGSASITFTNVSWVVEFLESA
jgi:hypothetical protein